MLTSFSLENIEMLFNQKNCEADKLLIEISSCLFDESFIELAFSINLLSGRLV